MTKKGFFGVLLCLILLFGFVTVSCTSYYNVKEMKTGEFNKISKIAGKDFEVLGVVFVDSTITYTVSPFRLSERMEGEEITFDALMREAKRLYPSCSDIINVRIDSVLKTQTSVFDFFTGYTATWGYFANALAIRYTDALEDSILTINHGSGSSSSTSSFGEKKGFFAELFAPILNLFK